MSNKIDPAVEREQMFQLTKLQPLKTTPFSLEDTVMYSYNIMQLLRGKAVMHRTTVTHFEIAVEDRTLAVFDEFYPNQWTISVCPALTLVMLEGFQLFKNN